MSDVGRDEAGGAPASGTAARRAKQQAAKQATKQAAKPASARPASAGSTTDPAPGAPRLTTRQLDPDRLAALEEERDFLLGSLDDLEREHDAGDVDEADYLALKDDYTVRAAAVLRAIDERDVAMAAARPPRNRARGWLIGAVVVLLALGAGVAVAQASGRREAGQTTSGDIRQTTRDKLLRAQQLFGDGKILDAVKVYDEVLAEQPSNVQALTYKGWLLRLTATGTQDANDRDVLLARSKELLDQAVTTDPTYADARVFRAILLDGLGQPQAALADLDALKPGDVPVFMTDMVAQLRTRIEAEVGGTPGSAPGSVPATAARPTP